MKFGGIFDLEAKNERLLEVQRELEEPTIWNNPERAQTLGRERVQLDEIVSSIKEIATGLKDAAELFELAVQEDDPGTVTEVIAELDNKSY